MSDMPEADAFQVLYDLLAQLEAEQPKRFQTLRVKTAVKRLERLYAEGMTTIEALRAKVSELQDERVQYADRLEIEQRDHEVTKGYRAHAEAQLEESDPVMVFRDGAWQQEVKRG